ncbi:MAG: epoxyqueuosine reductase [Paracoccaceae bacterium]|jgi:epoxyqueuosine reductase
MKYAQIEAACLEQGLAIFGAFHTVEADNAPKGCQTLILLGPHEPGFWQRITSSPEYAQADPIDRWSTRVVGQLATDLDAAAIFPFGGPPYQPFVSWAMRSGRVWQSPVALMVHDTSGMFLSYRGALAFQERLDIPAANAASPCETCADQPCLTACPASALTAEGYDLAACHQWLDGQGLDTCLSSGCLVRRACPISQSYGRLDIQTAHHMRAFHKG